MVKYRPYLSLTSKKPMRIFDEEPEAAAEAEAPAEE